MSWLSDIAGTVGGIAGTVGNFVGGPWGAALKGIGAAGSFIGGSAAAKNAQNKANQYAGMTEAQIKQMQALYDRLYPAATAAIDMAQQTPYAGYTGLDPYGTQVQNGAYQKYGEDTLQGADAAAASLKNFYAGNGIVGGTGLNQGVGKIYGMAGQGLGDFRRSLTERGAVAKRQEFIDSENARWQRLYPLLGMLSGTGANIANGIGGQQTMAQQRADSISAGLGGSLGELAAQAGSLFGLGNNRMGTNQKGSVPGTPPYVPSTWATGQNTNVGYGQYGGDQFVLGRRG